MSNDIYDKTTNRVNTAKRVVELLAANKKGVSGGDIARVKTIFRTKNMQTRSGIYDDPLYHHKTSRFLSGNQNYVNDLRTFLVTNITSNSTLENNVIDSINKVLRYILVDQQEQTRRRDDMKNKTKVKRGDSPSRKEQRKLIEEEKKNQAKIALEKQLKDAKKLVRIRIAEQKRIRELIEEARQMEEDKKQQALIDAKIDLGKEIRNELVLNDQRISQTIENSIDAVEEALDEKKIAALEVENLLKILNERQNIIERKRVNDIGTMAVQLNDLEDAEDDVRQVLNDIENDERTDQLEKLNQKLKLVESKVNLERKDQNISEQKRESQERREMKRQESLRTIELKEEEQRLASEAIRLAQEEERLERVRAEEQRLRDEQQLIDDYFIERGRDMRRQQLATIADVTDVKRTIAEAEKNIPVVVTDDFKERIRDVIETFGDYRIPELDEIVVEDVKEARQEIKMDEKESNLLNTIVSIAPGLRAIAPLIVMAGFFSGGLNPRVRNDVRNLKGGSNVLSYIGNLAEGIAAVFAGRQPEEGIPRDEEKGLPSDDEEDTDRKNSDRKQPDDIPPPPPPPVNNKLAILTGILSTIEPVIRDFYYADIKTLDSSDVDDLTELKNQFLDREDGVTDEVKNVIDDSVRSIDRKINDIRNVPQNVEIPEDETKDEENIEQSTASTTRNITLPNEYVEPYLRASYSMPSQEDEQKIFDDGLQEKLNSEMLETFDRYTLFDEYDKNNHLQQLAIKERILSEKDLPRPWGNSELKPYSDEKQHFNSDYMRDVQMPSNNTWLDPLPQPFDGNYRDIDDSSLYDDTLVTLRTSFELFNFEVADSVDNFMTASKKVAVF